MIREINKDVMFLSQKAVPATPSDVDVCKDLLDTLNANKDRCVGMAANMIGVNKNIICVSLPLYNLIMINPKIISKKEKYNAVEGCLSLSGERPCERYKEIEVEYYDMDFKKQKNIYKDFIAEIIQHEIDHTNGIII